MPDIAKMVNMWMLVEALHMLQELKVFELLSDRGKDGLNIETICQITETEKAEMTAALVFVSVMLPDVLGRTPKDKYVLKEGYSSFFFQNSLQFSKAYAPVIHNLKEISTKKLIYGVDIVRESDALSISSEIYAKNIAIDLVSQIGMDTFDSVVDLGCGSGHMVQRAIQILNCVGVGIDDFSREKQYVYSQSKDTPFLFIQGDIKQPDSWNQQLPSGKKVFIASMVLHELLYMSENSLILFFEKYQKLFAGSIMYIVEYNGYSPDELEKVPNDLKHLAAAYQFVHPFSKQGLSQSPEQWKHLFKLCKLGILGCFTTWQNSTIYKIQL